MTDQDPTAPGLANADPNPGSPQGEQPDSAQDSPTQAQPQPVSTAEQRLAAAQADITRRATENAALRRQIEELTAQATAPEGDDEQAPQARGASLLRQQLEAERSAREQAEWQLAQSIYGSEITEPFIAATTLLTQAETYSDQVTAFEAYHQARLKGAQPPPAPATGTPQREAAVQPRVDPNRGTPDLSDLNQQAEAARQASNLPGLIGALRQKAGW